MNVQTEFSLAAESSLMIRLQKVFEKMPDSARRANASDNLGDLIYITGLYTPEDINYVLQWGGPSVCFGKFFLARTIQELYSSIQKISISSFMTRNYLADLISRIALRFDENFMSLDHTREHLMREWANVIVNALSWKQDYFTGLRYLWPAQPIVGEIDWRIAVAVNLVILASIFENAPDVLPSMSWRTLIYSIANNFIRISNSPDLPVQILQLQIDHCIGFSIFTDKPKKSSSDAPPDSEAGNTIGNRNAPAGAIDIGENQLVLPAAPVEKASSALNADIRDILIAVKEGPKKSKEIALFLNLSGKQVKVQGLEPAMKAGLIQPLYQVPRHPRQAYTLTETGRKLLETSSE